MRRLREGAKNGIKSISPHMPEQKHLLSTLVVPQSGTSSHRGSKNFPLPPSLRGMGFMAQTEPGGFVPSETYVPLYQICLPPTPPHRKLCLRAMSKRSGVFMKHASVSGSDAGQS